MNYQSEFDNEIDELGSLHKTKNGTKNFSRLESNTSKKAIPKKTLADGFNRLSKVRFEPGSNRDSPDF